MARSRGIAVAAAAGDVLGVVFGAAAAVRGKKPLHPRGVVVRARVERTGASEPWGVPWLDEPGTDEGLVRLSRAAGLPSGWPDVLGLALSFHDGTGRHDLLLASTGMAPGARYVLLPRVRAASAAYGSLFPYRTPRGHAVLAATPGREPRALTLSAATPFGRWQPFAVLRMHEDPVTSHDELVDLDPVRHPLPGLELAPLLAALRAPAYAAARRMRPDSRESRPADGSRHAEGLRERQS